MYLFAEFCQRAIVRRSRQSLVASRLRLRFSVETCVQKRCMTNSPRHASVLARDRDVHVLQRTQQSMDATFDGTNVTFDLTVRTVTVGGCVGRRQPAFRRQLLNLFNNLLCKFFGTASIIAVKNSVSR